MADALGTPPAAATPTVGVVSAIDHRLALAGLVAPQTSSLAVRTGVMWGPGSTALITGTSATGTMTVNVAAHHWGTTRGTPDGIYLGTKETSTTVNIAAAPGANSRIDVVYVKQNDSSSSISPDGSTGELYAVATGTAAASPTKPAIPTGAVELGTVTVAVGATSTNGAGVTISNTARLTVARGAPIPCRTQAERDALTTYALLTVLRLDTGNIEVRNETNTAWKTLPFVSDWPVAFLRQATGQTGLASGWNTIALDAEDLDSHSGHSTSTSNSRFTVPAGQAGTWAVEGGVVFAATAAGLVMSARITKNGTALAASTGNYAAVGGATGGGSATGRKILTLAAGDYVELQGYVNGAAWATAVGADSASWLAVERIR